MIVVYVRLTASLPKNEQNLGSTLPVLSSIRPSFFVLLLKNEFVEGFDFVKQLTMRHLKVFLRRLRLMDVFQDSLRGEVGYRLEANPCILLLVFSHLCVDRSVVDFRLMAAPEPAQEACNKLDCELIAHLISIIQSNLDTVI